MKARYRLALLWAAPAACLKLRAETLEAAAAYLWKQQAGDGGWHSTTYGLLRSGQSMTAFVLEALLRVPETLAARPRGGVDRAVAFLRRHTRADGAVGVAQDVPDYPNYATALTVLAYHRVRREDLHADIARHAGWLRGQQFAEANGWTEESAAYGGWGMGGAVLRPPVPGHVDLSMTRHILEALRAALLRGDDPVFQRARVYLARLQNRDGGFFFSTTEEDTNKAGRDGEAFRSYGSTTADGVLALRAAGVPENDAALQRALGWLRWNHAGLETPGFVGPAYRRWPGGLSFYYVSAVTSAMGSDAAVRAGLERRQRADGSWSNPENLVKEDDPLIATPFAIHALSGRRPAASE